MTTLNGGFVHSEDSNKIISASDKSMIAAYLKKNEVTICPPCSAAGNEETPSTHARIIEKRKEFRAAQRAKKKQSKEDEK